MKKVIAIEMGFYGGVRIREGQRFAVPDNTEGKWFVPEKDYKPKKQKTMADISTLSQASKRNSKSFIEAIKGTSEEEPDRSSDQSVI